MASVRSQSAPAKATRPFSCSFVSITIQVSDIRYSVDPIPSGDLGTKAFRLSKHSGDHLSYDVVRQHDGIVACDCPDYERRHRGNGHGMCKHGRALVELGLLPKPIAPTAPTVEPRTLHDGYARDQAALRAFNEANGIIDATPLPRCSGPGCVLPGKTTMTDGTSWCRVCLDMANEPGGKLFVPFVEPSAPCCGTAETSPCMACVASTDIDDVLIVATPADSQDDRQAASRAFLDRSATLGLSELIDRQTEFYRGWGNPAGEMIARAMEELALKIRMTESTTPAEFESRVEVLDAEVREGWERIGRESALAVS